MGGELFVFRDGVFFYLYLLCIGKSYRVLFFIGNIFGPVHWFSFLSIIPFFLEKLSAYKGVLESSGMLSNFRVYYILVGFGGGGLVFYFFDFICEDTTCSFVFCFFWVGGGVEDGRRMR